MASIVDWMKGNGQDSSFANRKKLAEQNGIANYRGTADQNLSLLGMLQKGGASSPAPAASLAGGTPAAVAAGSTAAAPSGPAGSASGSGSKTNKSTSYQKYYTKPNYRNNYYDTMEYEPSDEVEEYYGKMQQTEAARPDPYKSKYTEQIDNILNGILNNKGFSYKAEDMMNDDLYQLYRQQYQQNAQRAMRDTMGAAQAMTGGYGSTYSQAAAQQAYDQTMAGLNDRALDFYDRAFARYQDERNNEYNKLGAVENLDNTDYGRYRDTVTDWQTDRNYYANRYDTLYGQDFARYQDQVQQNQFAANMDFEIDRARDAAEQYAASLGLQTDQQAEAEREWNAEFDLQKRKADQDYEIAQWQYEQAKQNAAKAAAGGSGGSGRRSSGTTKRSGSTQDQYKYNGQITQTDAMNQMKYIADKYGVAASDQYAKSLLNQGAIIKTAATKKTNGEALADYQRELAAEAVKNGAVNKKKYNYEYLPGIMENAAYQNITGEKKKKNK